VTIRTEASTEAPSLLEHISTHWSVVGDPLKFVLRYAPAVGRYVGALLRNAHDAEDVVQDFLLKRPSH
jgi:hypothetical protein